MKPQGFSFVHKRSARSRRIRIHIEADGTIVVITPLYFPTGRVPSYIEEAREWIEKRLAEVKLKPQLLNSTAAYYFGQPHGIITTEHQDGKVVVREGKIYVSPLRMTPAATKLLLETWLKHRCIEYCLPRLEALADKMKVEFRGVRFKQQQTCWGSCSSDKNLNFNWRLIHAPREVIDYVIIHELAHIIHMNHGSQFWDLVAKFDPDHPLHRGWLKRYGSTTD